MSKLTLSIDDRVIECAKRYAKEHSTSVSAMVERYLDAVTRPLKAVDDPPILREIKGILGGGDREAYRQHLIVKYR